MEYNGAAVYDDDEFLDNYLTRRHRAESPNNVIEKPVLMELIGDVSGKKILDLGCGDAEFGLELLKQGCSFYEGVEGSLNMVKKAKDILDPTGGKVHHSSMEDWDYPHEQYDLVVSRLALHYLENVEFVFKRVYSSLQEGGEFVFSVQHPILTSSVQSATKSARTNWTVDDYFHTGKRVEPWIAKEVVKYHRTIEQYFQELKRAGFKIEEISECRPRPENFKSEEEYRRRMRIPLFLVFACSK